MPHNKIKYAVEKAESNSIQTNSVDLLTIANALHWFNFDLFYKEANRVLKTNGIIAAWCYCIPTIEPLIDEMVNHYHYQTLNDYWLAENRLVEKEYTTIPFPFKEIIPPLFYFKRSMTLRDFIGYLNTWSATQRFIAQNNFNPTEKLHEELLTKWGNADTERTLTWKLVVKAGRKQQHSCYLNTGTAAFIIGFTIFFIV